MRIKSKYLLFICGFDEKYHASTNKEEYINFGNSNHAKCSSFDFWNYRLLFKKCKYYKKDKCSYFICG